MKFVKRLTAPDKDNKYYLRPNKGYNKCIQGNSKSGVNYGKYDVLPNCTGWCYGRFLESQVIEKCDLPRCDAENWLLNNKKYQEGWTARVGAILVFAKGKVGNSKDGAGHVIFVEAIDKEGTLTVSESGWSAKKRMWTDKMSLKSNGGYYYKHGYTYLGCIYSPTNFEQYFYGELPTANLHRGSKGKQVKHLQQFLNWCLGTDLEIDGSYGGKTEKAVREFEKQYNLQIDGKFGPACRRTAKTVQL